MLLNVRQLKGGFNSGLTPNHQVESFPREHAIDHDQAGCLIGRYHIWAFRGSSLCSRSARSRLTMGRSMADRGLLSTLDGLGWHSGYSAVASTSFSRVAPAFRRSLCGSRGIRPSCGGFLARPTELGAVGPDAVHDDRQLPRDRDDGPPQAAPLRDSHAPRLQRRPPLRPR